MAQADSKPTILALPREIRDKILESSLPDKFDIDLPGMDHDSEKEQDPSFDSTHPRGHLLPSYGIFLACKQLHDESVPLYWKTTRFQSLYPQTILRWLPRLSPTQRDLLREVYCNFRWVHQNAEVNDERHTQLVNLWWDLLHEKYCEELRASVLKTFYVDYYDFIVEYAMSEKEVNAIKEEHESWESLIDAMGVGEVQKKWQTQEHLWTKYEGWGWYREDEEAS